MKNAPTGVKIISVLYYISVVFGILFGLLLFVGAGFVSLLFEGVDFLQFAGSTIFIVFGIISIAFGILNFFIARGLWKGKNWSRILVIIFSIISIVFAIIFMIISKEFLSNIVSIIFSGIIGGYLLLNQNVKDFFN